MSYDNAPTFGQRLDGLLSYIAPNQNNSQQPLAIKAQSQAVFDSDGKLSHFNNDAIITHANARGRQVDIPLSELVKQLPSNSPFALEGDGALFQASLKNLKLSDAGTNGFSLKTKLADDTDATLFVQRKDSDGLGQTLTTGGGVFLGTLGAGVLLGAPALAIAPFALLAAGGVMAYQAFNNNAGKVEITQAINTDGELSLSEHEVALSPFDTDPLASSTATDKDLDTSSDDGVSPFADPDEASATTDDDTTEE
jgi:hypothetical protein